MKLYHYKNHIAVVYSTPQNPLNFTTIPYAPHSPLPTNTIVAAHLKHGTLILPPLTNYQHPDILTLKTPALNYLATHLSLLNATPF